MAMNTAALTFGPVPSRRLGRSLGINNIPPKTCSYGCVYCQVGRTTRMLIRRQAFFAPEWVLQKVREKVQRLTAAEGRLDFMTFVPDGEPTLDVNLGRTIRLLKSLGYPVGVISNASLMADAGVQDDLAAADWVSLKVDAVADGVWRRIDRPHGKLQLTSILEGIRTFSRVFQGRLVTETMLVAGLNDDRGNLEATARFLASVGPQTAYLAVPTRPPAEEWVRPPDEESLHQAYRVFTAALPAVELLVAFEGGGFNATDEAGAELLAITAVHPMREDAALAFLEKAGKSAATLEEFLQRGLLTRLRYRDAWFYLRRFSR
jgi:wyosine [tRNA(Phe)-imidazoG37] synthetase (radical SAM superfamily)